MVHKSSNSSAIFFIGGKWERLMTKDCKHRLYFKINQRLIFSNLYNANKEFYYMNEMLQFYLNIVFVYLPVVLKYYTLVQYNVS